MGRNPKVNYQLDTCGVKDLPNEEISAIVRAADELIATGGRSTVIKLF